MPDNPINHGSGDSPNPEDKLRKLIEDIERDEPRNPNFSLPPSEEEKTQQTNDTSYTVSPLEDAFGGKDDSSNEKELDEEELKLREIDERLGALRGKLPDPPEWDYKRPKSSTKNKVEENNYLGMGVGISVAYTMVGCTLAGWGIGKLIDLRSGGFLGQAIGTLVGAVIGLVAAIITIIKAQNKPGQ